MAGTGIRIRIPFQSSGLQERLHQGEDAFLLGQASEEQDIRPRPGLCIIELMRIRHTSTHRHLRIRQEILHGNGTPCVSALIQFALHEFRRRDNRINLVIRMVILQKFSFHGSKQTLGTRSLHTHIFCGMHESPIQASVAHFTMPVDHSVCGANKNIIMRRIHHRHMMFLQIRCIKNRERQLAMHIVHVDHIWLEFL